jgi:hypothetical protein
MNLKKVNVELSENQIHELLAFGMDDDAPVAVETCLRQCQNSILRYCCERLRAIELC